MRRGDIYITIEQTYNTGTSKLRVGFEPLHFKQRKKKKMPFCQDQQGGLPFNAVILLNIRKDTNRFKFQCLTEATVYELNYTGLERESQDTIFQFHGSYTANNFQRHLHQMIHKLLKHQQ